MPLHENADRLRKRYPWASSSTGFGAWFRVATEWHPPNTLRAYCFAVDAFITSCHRVGVDPEQATAEDVSRFMREMRRGVGRAPVTDTTIRARVAALRACFGFLVQAGYAERNPVPVGSRSGYGLGRGWTDRRGGRELPHRSKKLPRIPSRPEWER